MDTESIQKTLKIFNFTTTYAILMKVTTDIYLNKVFHLPKSSVCLIGCEISQKITFLAEFRPFLSTSKTYSISDASSCLSSLVKNTGCFWETLAKNPPKSSINDSFYWYENILKFKTGELQIPYQ